MMKLIELKHNKQSPIGQSSLKELHFTPGVWINGKCYWLQNNSEKVIYEEELILQVKQNPIHSKISFSSIYISNHSSKTKNIKVLTMNHYVNASPDHFTFASPKDYKIYHLSNKNVYLVNAQFNGEGGKDYTIQPYWNVFTDQIWSSLDKGSLMYQPMYKGHAASIFVIKMMLNPRETKKINTWTICGNNKNEVNSLDLALLKNTLAFPYEK